MRHGRHISRFTISILFLVACCSTAVAQLCPTIYLRDAPATPGVSVSTGLQTGGRISNFEFDSHGTALEALCTQGAPKPGVQVWSVCPSGCDATSIAAGVALAQAAPDVFDSRLGSLPVRRVVTVGQGIYWETPFSLGEVELVGAIPSGIGLGIDQPAGPVIFFGETASGDLITLGKGASISNLFIQHLGIPGAGTVPTGPITILRYAGGDPTSYSRIHNVTVRSTTTDLTAGSITFLHADATGRSLPGEQYLNITQVDILQATGTGGGSQTSFRGSGGGKSYLWNTWLWPGLGTGLVSETGSKIGLYDVKTSQSSGMPGGWGVAELSVDGTSTIYHQASPTETVSIGNLRALDRTLGAQSLTVADSGGAGVAAASLDLWQQSLALICSDPDGCELTLGTSNALPGQRVAVVALTNSVRLSGETLLCISLEAIYLDGAWRRLAGHGCS